MSEETNIEQQAANVQETNLANPFSEESWVDNSVKADDQSVQTQQSEPSQPKTEEGEIYDANEYLKLKLGFDNWDDAANQITEMRQNPKLGFENDDSRKFYEYARENKEEELIKFLEEKRKIDKLSTSDIKDADTASEIVKLSMYHKNKELDQSEIDFLFNEQFKKPAKPDQKFDELDSEYDERISSWESRINEIDKKLIIEAKLAKPEIEKIKSSLILPDISPNVAQREYTQEELGAQQRYMDNYYSNVNEVISSFDGLSATVKDEGADFSVAYIPSFEEKAAVADQLKYFAENNLDANMIFAERWVHDDGTINVKQMTKDLFLLQNENKIAQKYVNDAANKKLTMHLRKQSNVSLNSIPSNETFNPSNQQSEMDKLAAVMFAK